MCLTDAEWWWGDGKDRGSQCYTLKFVVIEKWGQKMLALFFPYVFYSESEWRGVEVLIYELPGQGDCWSSALLAWRSGHWGSALSFVSSTNWGLVKAKRRVWILAPGALVRCVTVTQQLVLLRNPFPCSPCFPLRGALGASTAPPQQNWYFLESGPILWHLDDIHLFFWHRISLFKSPFPSHFNIEWVISHLLGPLTYAVSFYLNCSYSHWFYFNFFYSWENQQSRVEKMRAILRGELGLDLSLRWTAIAMFGGGGWGLGLCWLLVSQCYNKCQRDVDNRQAGRDAPPIHIRQWEAGLLGGTQRKPISFQSVTSGHLKAGDESIWGQSLIKKDSPH